MVLVFRLTTKKMRSVPEVIFCEYHQATAAMVQRRELLSLLDLDPKYHAEELVDFGRLVVYY
jgi:hypothetical protein